jgi:hypothetical protein
MVILYLLCDQVVSPGLGYGPFVVSCEYNNDLLDSTKANEIFEWLSYHQHFEKESAHEVGERPFFFTNFKGLLEV